VQVEELAMGWYEPGGQLVQVDKPLTLANVCGAHSGQDALEPEYGVAVPMAQGVHA
jgi:hypothetical protein